jgi:hypothetical protein
MLGKRSGIGGSEGLSVGNYLVNEIKCPSWKEKVLTKLRQLSFFRFAMKKIAFVITPDQWSAFEAARKSSALGIEPAAAVARRLFLIGLSQAGVQPTKLKRTK